jgi:hypothetical protein
MAENPLKLLSRLRRFDPNKSVEEYLHTEMRQNLKAIEDAFKNMGSTSAGIRDSSASYCLYVKKTASMPTVTTTYTTIAGWDDPTDNIGTGGTFDKITGEWTCDTEDVYTFRGRAGIASNTGDEIYLKFLLDAEIVTAGWGFSLPKRGPEISFSRKILVGQVVRLQASSLGGGVAMQADSNGPIFFNVVKD